MLVLFSLLTLPIYSPHSTPAALARTFTSSLHSCRVFKGRWHGMDVAVKVMDPCTPETLPRVLKEAEVMMGLKHQNIVTAYQCSVWSKRQQQQLMQVRHVVGGTRGHQQQVFPSRPKATRMTPRHLLCRPFALARTALQQAQLSCKHIYMRLGVRLVACV